MDTSNVYEFLKNKVPLFKDFGSEEIKELIDKSHVTTAITNEAILEFGQKGEFLGVIIEGSAVVSIIDDNGVEQELASLSKGDIFGEIALMSGDLVMANLVTRSKFIFLKIPSDIFTTLVLSKPSAMTCLIKILTKRSKELAFKEQHRNLSFQAEIKSSDPHGLMLSSSKPELMLIINCGSSSLKYALYDTESTGCKVSGVVERIGLKDPVHKSTSKNVNIKCTTHTEAFELVSAFLIDNNYIKSTSEITSMGHRVVHGGNLFAAPVIIDKNVIEKLEKIIPLAPLHNPANIEGIKLAFKKFENATQVAVFDTGFHHTLPAYAYLYGLPYKYFEELGVRKYGFHGISHSYVSLKTAWFLNRPYTSMEMITCHLGNGSSVCAVDHGRSIDTSMGMTPTSGLIMGTRTGDVDPGALCYIAKKDGLNPDEMDTLINKKSGLLGMSENSGDMRELTSAANGGDYKSLLAIKTLCYNLRKYIGSYAAAMQGLDAVVFTGGIGENSALIRSLACQGLEFMGIILDDEQNRAADSLNEPVIISAQESRIQVLMVPTDEELMIARETLNVKNIHNETNSNNIKNEIPVEVSAHHIHLTEEHIRILFGEGHKLTPVSNLSQPGQYASKERVTLTGPKGSVDNVRVLGPARSKTQVEISMTEQFKLGVHPPIRESGDIEDTPGIRLTGPNGSVDIKKGVICAMRHIHMTPRDAILMGVRDRYIVSVKIGGERELTFGDVIVRVSPDFSLAMHIDTDEANAADIKSNSVAIIESIQSKK
ncbi:MAG: acetate/propionate family kinase [Deltaproteobacteria bacterium]|nr:acetate/propionate family kinase [Deltaproteobacteria bacterium]